MKLIKESDTSSI